MVCYDKKMTGFPTFEAGVLIIFFFERGVLIVSCTRPEIRWQCHPLVNRPRENVIKVPRACSRARDEPARGDQGATRFTYQGAQRLLSFNKAPRIIALLFQVLKKCSIN
jgi:hypothetical protein